MSESFAGETPALPEPGPAAGHQQGKTASTYFSYYSPRISWCKESKHFASESWLKRPQMA